MQLAATPPLGATVASVNLKNCQNKIVFLQVTPPVYPTARRHRSKLIGPHENLQVGK